MATKLTLALDQRVIEQAKAYAKMSGKSLSSIVEEYLKTLSGKEVGDKKHQQIKALRELKGSVNIPTTKKSVRNDLPSYDALLEDALLEEYLKR